MNRILLNEKQRIRRRAARFVDFNYSQQRSTRGSKLNNVSTGVEVNFAFHTESSKKHPPAPPPPVSIESNHDDFSDLSGCQSNSFMDEEEFELLPSDSSDDEDEQSQPTFDLKKALTEWVINAKIPAYHVDELLSILRNVAPSLPKCCKTLCKTPRVANINVMDNGHYLHVGLKDCLERFLSKNNFKGDCITIDIGIDGVGASKSSSSDIWPILVSVVGVKYSSELSEANGAHSTNSNSNTIKFDKGKAKNK